MSLTNGKITFLERNYLFGLGLIKKLETGSSLGYAQRLFGETADNEIFELENTAGSDSDAPATPWGYTASLLRGGLVVEFYKAVSIDTIILRDASINFVTISIRVDSPISGAIPDAVGNNGQTYTVNSVNKSVDGVSEVVYQIEIFQNSNPDSVPSVIKLPKVFDNIIGIELNMWVSSLTTPIKIGAIVFTNEIGEFAGYPEISGLNYSLNEKASKNLVGEYDIVKQKKTIRPFNINFRGYSHLADIELCQQLLERYAPFNLNIAGGKDQMRYPILGLGPLDLILVQTRGELKSRLRKGSYNGLIDAQLKLVPAI